MDSLIGFIHALIIWHFFIKLNYVSVGKRGYAFLPLLCVCIYWLVNLVYCDEHEGMSFFVGGDSIPFGCMTQKKGDWLM